MSVQNNVSVQKLLNVHIRYVTHHRLIMSKSPTFCQISRMFRQKQMPLFMELLMQSFFLKPYLVLNVVGAEKLFQ